MKQLMERISQQNFSDDLAYRNDPKFSDRYAIANSADPDA